jgi:hypothetical protein
LDERRSRINGVMKEEAIRCDQKDERGYIERSHRREKGRCTITEK